MKKSSTFALLLAVLLSLSLTACGGSGAQPVPTDAPKDDGTYTVGICQLVQHSAHDSATQGFVDALNEALPGRVRVESHVASNDIAACSGIVNQFIAEEVDLILANATPALQIASAATAEIPILGTSVTSYSVALDLEDFDGVVGGNISGTSDLAPLDQQAVMLQECFPDVKNVGLLYCSAEANSAYQVNTMEALLTEAGYSCKQYSFTDSNDLPSVLEGVVANCDVLYVPTDNTVAANGSIIDNVCRPAGVPVIGGERGICDSCAVATLSITYYDIGYTTGQMAVQILTGEADISEMPIQHAEAARLYNPDICADLALSPPAGYEAIQAP